MSTPANALDITQAGVVSFDGSSIFTGSPVTNHSVLVGSTSNAVTSITAGTNNQVLLGNTGSNPSFGSLTNAALPGSGQVTLSNGTNISVTGSPVALGGTATVNVSGPPSATTLTQYGVVCGNGTGAVTATGTGTLNQILMSQGAGANPAYSTATYPATSGAAGNVIVSNGTNLTSTTITNAILPGTGAVTLSNGTNISVTGSPLSLGGTATVNVSGPPSATTLTNHGVVIGQGSSAVVATATGSVGQILRSGGSAADPSYSTATYPATAGTSGNVITSDGTNFSSSPMSTAISTSFATPSGTAVPSGNVLTFANGTGVSITGSGSTVTVALNGSALGQTITGDSGGAISPTAGNWNIQGQQAGSVSVATTTGSGSTLSVENRAWTTPLVVDPSSTVGLRGTFTTIGSALTAASSGQDIFIRPGTYTENITLKAGVNLVGYTGDGDSQQVIILGTCTALFAGTCCISNIQLKTNNAPFLTVSGSSATIIDLIGCVLNASNNTGISFTSSSSSAKINGKYCQGLIGTTGLAFFVSSSAGNMNFAYSNLGNSGASTVASSTSGGSVGFDHCLVFFPVSSSSTGGINGNYTEFSTSSINTESITHNGTTSGSLAYCKISSNTADCMTVGSGAAMLIRSSSFTTTNTNSIVGGGSLTYSGVTLPSGGVVTVTTQTPNISLRDACTVTSPGAYPYTTVPQDYLITVNTALARTIVPLANPTKGQIHIIKDNIGLASLNNITVTPSGKNINGAASYTINNNYGSIIIIYDGSQWDIISKF